MAQGQGPNTQRKQDGFARLFRQSLYISLGVAEYPYWHIDLNAGCGYNEVAGCDGSPVVFIQEAICVGRSFRAFFCDIDPEAIKRLKAAVFATRPWPGDSGVSAQSCDNAEFLPHVAGIIKATEGNSQHAIGTCLCDPNGFPHGYPGEALADFAGRFPKIDLILNFNASLFAMVRGCKESGRESHQKGFAHWPELGDVVSALPRPHWWIRNPPKGKDGAMRFITFLGRTRAPDRRRFADFYPLTSHIGQFILKTLRRDNGGWLFPELEEP